MGYRGVGTKQLCFGCREGSLGVLNNAASHVCRVAFEAAQLNRRRKVFLEMKQSFRSLRWGRLGPPAQSKQQRLPPFCVAKSTQLDILKFVFMSVRNLSDLRG